MCNCSKNSKPAGAGSPQPAQAQQQNGLAAAREADMLRQTAAASRPTGVSITFALQTPQGVVRGSRLEVQAARIRQGGMIVPGR